MSTFTILKQQNRQMGCIPACAASVLRHLQISKSPDWSENFLLAMYPQPLPSPLPSGFDLLSNFLKSQPEMNGWEVVKNGTDLGLKDIVTTLVKQFGPALIHLDGNSAHCVVIVDPDENGATICDPWPDNLDQKITWEDVENGRLKFGELLYFKKAQS